MEQEPQINEHNKQEYPPMHTAEHILNATMVKVFGCGRAVTAHIERKKSKCDYLLPREPPAAEIDDIARRVNDIIAEDLPVTVDYIKAGDAVGEFDLSRLPDDASEMLRVVCVGDYDRCLCAGAHVARTSEIGRFVLLGYNYENGKLRIRFKLQGESTARA